MKEKIQKLKKYIAETKSKLADAANRPETYKRFLQREIDMHQKKIEQLELESGPVGKK